MVGSVNIENYLTMVALEDDFQVLIPDELLYCIDGTSWERLSSNSYTPKIKSGQTISFVGSITSFQGSVKTFKITKPCNLTGNCMSVSGGESPAFTRLFSDCSLIKSVSKDFLPATTLADSCYSSMFSGCTSLTSAPELPAVRLYEGCYTYMFKYCRKLDHIKMFGIKCRTIADGSGSTNEYMERALKDWVLKVSATGTFIKNVSAVWNITGGNGVPEGWTVTRQPLIKVVNTIYVTIEEDSSGRYTVNARSSFPVYEEVKVACKNRSFYIWDRIGSVGRIEGKPTKSDFNISPSEDEQYIYQIEIEQ